MTRLFLVLTTLTALVGCSQTPRIDPLASFGTTRVPAPATNSYGVANKYYQRTAPQPNQQSEVLPIAPPPSVAASTASPSGWRETDERRVHVAGTMPTVAAESTVKPVVHEAVVAKEPAIRIVEQSRPSQSELQLRGMHVNDATGQYATGQPVTIDQLSTEQTSTATSPSPQAFTPSPSAAPIGTGVSSTASMATKPMRWQSRYDR